MAFFTKAQTKKLLANNAKTVKTGKGNFKPVVKIFGGSSCTWLITDMDENGTCFGLADLGFGTPELGSFSMDEIMQMRFKPFNLGVERDKYFTADKPIQEYADIARNKGRIIS